MYAFNNHKISKKYNEWIMQFKQYIIINSFIIYTILFSSHIQNLYFSLWMIRIRFIKMRSDFSFISTSICSSSSNIKFFYCISSKISSISILCITVITFFRSYSLSISSNWYSLILLRTKSKSSFTSYSCENWLLNNIFWRI